MMASEIFGLIGSPQYQGYAIDMLQSGYNLLELINDILDVSRIEVRELVLDEEWSATE